MRTIFWKKSLGLAKHTLPWLVAAGVLYWLFQQYPIDKVIDAISLVNPYYFLAAVILYFLYVWWVDCFAMATILTRFTEKIHWKELMAPRAATYLLAMVNYAAGQAALAYSIQRAHKIRVGDIIGIFWLITAVDLTLIVALAFGGTFLGDQSILGFDVSPSIRMAGYVTVALICAHLTFWLFHWEEKLTGRFWQRTLGWVRSKNLFRIFHEARLRDYGLIVLVRLPLHLMLVFCLYLILRMFQAEIPLLQVMGNVPVGILIGAIPISWGGIGTSNTALIDLLSPYITLAPSTAALVTPAELVLAASLLWMFANYLIKLLFGICFLSRVTRSIKESRDPSGQGSERASNSTTPQNAKFAAI